MEKHYTVYEIADMWKVSFSWVQGRFKSEPGVLHVGLGKKDILRIPESVLERVRDNLIVKGKLPKAQRRRSLIKRNRLPKEGSPMLSEPSTRVVV